MPVPIIDLFAGPGGLGEGFSQLGWRGGKPFFKVVLSVEKDRSAYRTLRLRSFVRQFPYFEIPEEYYRFLRDGRPPEDLLLLKKYSEQVRAADRETWNETLRDDPEFNAELDSRIRRALGGRKIWVLIGGPPCQAYSVVGRSRNKGKKGYVPEEDGRHFLYREYLRIISAHCPAVFVMENVKGLLSSKVNGVSVFQQILEDLRAPCKRDGHRYHVFSLTEKPASYDDPEFSDRDFVIRTEKYGIPQSRHRVILLGIREDLSRKWKQRSVLTEKPHVGLSDILTLPPLRSGLSKGKYNGNDWIRAVRRFPLKQLANEIRELADHSTLTEIRSALAEVRTPKNDMGGDYVAELPAPVRDVSLRAWYEDNRIQGVFNHSARKHMESDLHRYLYASCFAAAMGRSPKMREFPGLLKPAHKNRDSGSFDDRFRVQLWEKPATTITCHMSKDGHYFIHPDPCQCRSLTVREAARIQTFPDNYFFCGNRTEQYVQVGNAVPPLLAKRIAQIIKGLCEEGAR